MKIGLKIAFCVLVVSLGCLLNAQSNSSASVPPLVNYSGKVIGSGGKPVTGLTGITFALYKEQDGGSASADDEESGRAARQAPEQHKGVGQTRTCPSDPSPAIGLEEQRGAEPGSPYFPSRSDRNLVLRNQVIVQMRIPPSGYAADSYLW